MMAWTVKFCFSQCLKLGDWSIVSGIKATRRSLGAKSRMFFDTNRSATSTGVNPAAIAAPYFAVVYLPHGGFVRITVGALASFPLSWVLR